MALLSSRTRRRLRTSRAPSAARILVVVAGVLALGASAVWLMGRGFPSAKGVEGGLDPIAAAVRGWTARPVEGRLSGGLDYARYDPEAAKETFTLLSPVGQRLFEAERTIFRGPGRAATPRSTSSDLGTRGRILLLWGEPSEAVAALEEATLDGPASERSLSDLAVAYLARAAEEGDAGDFARALEASEKALAIDPTLAEARFNRALALDALYLQDVAAQAWEGYLEVDPDSGWAGEARARLEELQTARPPTGPVKPAGLPEAASNDPREGAARDRLEAGVTLYQQFRLQEAEEVLTAARSELAVVASPLTPWAEYYLALCRYQQADYAGALARIERVLDAPAAESGRRNEVLGRSLQLAGLIHNIEGRFGEGLAAYRQAARQLQQSQDLTARIGVQSSLSNAYEQLGDRRTAWRYRYAALAEAASLDPRGRMRLYAEPTSAVLRAGLPHAAVYFATAMVRAAEETENPGFSVAAYRRRSEVWESLEAPDRARSDLDRALRESAAIQDPTVASITRADILLTRSDLEADRSPEDALADVTEALAIYRATDNRSGEPRALRSRARIQRGLGNLAPARSDLDRALTLLEAQHRGVGGLELREEFFGEARPVFEEMVSLALERGDRAQALATAERAHEAGSRDLWGSRPRPRVRERLLSLEDARATLPPGTALLEYFVLPDRLLVGLVRREGVWVRQVAVGASEVDRLVQAFRRRLVRGTDRESVRAAGSRLFDRLIAPVRDQLRAGDDLVVIPDGPLHGVPFAALWDDATGRYLLEDHLILSSPSATYAVAAGSGRTGLPIRGSSKILVVSDPEPDPALPDLPALPGARREARLIQVLFPGADLLSGGQASPARFLGEASRHDVVHFGGHAVANPDHPLLSYLALAPADGPGTGALFARDLVGDRAGHLLGGTRLVVLAACRSGDTGGAEGSAGLSSLSRAFLAAGVPLVIGSLWDAEDATTARLFELFYRALRQGVPPPAALRSAQLTMSSESGNHGKSAFAWAAFRVEGSIIEPPGPQ